MNVNLDKDIQCNWNLYITLCQYGIDLYCDRTLSFSLRPKLTCCVTLDKLLYFSGSLSELGWQRYTCWLFSPPPLLSDPEHTLFSHACILIAGSIVHGSRKAVKGKSKPNCVFPCLRRVAIGRGFYMKGRSIQVSATTHSTPGSVLMQLNVQLIL